MAKHFYKITVYGKTSRFLAGNTLAAVKKRIGYNQKNFNRKHVKIIKVI